MFLSVRRSAVAKCSLRELTRRGRTGIERSRKEHLRFDRAAFVCRGYLVLSPWLDLGQFLKGEVYHYTQFQLSRTDDSRGITRISSLTAV